MTTTNQTFLADGTFTAPATLLHGGVTLQVNGAPGSNASPYTGGAGARVTGGLAMVGGGTLTIYVGDYHKAGTGSAGVGGGSSAVVQSGTLQMEAGGGGGSALATSPYGGNGGYGGQPGGNGGGTSAGSGANSTTPGAGGTGSTSNGAAGTFGGAAGTANGGNAGSNIAASGGGGYAGGGGGGWSGGASYGTGGGGSSFFSASVSSGAITNAANTGSASVVVTYTVADPPLAPTLLTPTNGTVEEMNTVGPTFSFTYNPGTDSGAINGWAMRRKIGSGSYNYWNAAAQNWTATTPVWNASSFLSFAGSTASYTFPTGAWTDGNIYNWSIACQESSFSLQGPFAGDLTVTAQSAPVIAITAPGAIAQTATPAVSWTFTGTTQINYRVVYYTAAQAAIAGFTPGISPSTYDSGTVTSASTGFATPSAAGLQNGVTYVIYVMVNETGPIPSSWQHVTTLIAFDGPAAPLLLAVASNDAVTGQPFVTLSGASIENLLSNVDSTFETGIGTWIAITNASGTGSMTSSTTQALDQTHSLEISSTAAGAMTVGSATGAGGYAVTPGQSYAAMAFLRAGSAGRSCQVAINWYQAGGAASAVKAQSLGAAFNDVTTGWTEGSVIDTAPSDAAFAQVRVIVSATGAANEIHYIDQAGIFNAAALPPWTIGGYAASHANCTEEFQSSDDGGITWADLRFGAGVAVGLGATAPTSCLDYEAPPVISPTLNLLSAADSALSTIGSWAAFNACTVAQVATPVNIGKGAIALTNNAASNVMSAKQGALVPVTPGVQYTAIGYARAQVTSRNASLSIQFTNQNGTVISTVTGALVADSATGWVQVSVTGTCPVGACYASLISSIGTVTGNLVIGEIHYGDNFSLVYNPTNASVLWGVGSQYGIQRIYRSRVVDNTNPAQPIPGLWSNSAQATPPPTSNAHWYLSDPTVQASGVQFDLQTDWKPRIHEEATRYYPIGRPQGVKATDGMKGIGGQIETTTLGVDLWWEMMNLLQSTKTLLLQNPFGQWYISIEGDSMGDYLLTTVGRTDFSAAKHLLTYVNAAKP